ncbi:MAG: AAA family ATPase [Burkholderiaceae bacterium]|nr:AAA family ATPase [Burkholderiaceae bacterium]
MGKRKPDRLIVSNLGPIQSADVQFADLTVIVGPQATGKSIFLQTLKLLIDRDHIHDTFAHHSVAFNGNTDAFLDGYFGRGMAALWGTSSTLDWNGTTTSLPALAKPSKSKQRHARVFYIPAQRVMSLAGGVTQNFGQFNYGDPYALRAFSNAVHDLLQNEFGAKGELFPQANRLNPTLRKPIEEHVFGGSTLAVDSSEFTKRLVLKVPGHSTGLPFLAWSAGQREFTPLLLGLYWLCPVAAQRRRSGDKGEEAIEWVVIEEPEMGLHPQGIVTVLLLVLELLRRGYKVVLSTHSPVVLDMVWALREFQQRGGTEGDVRALFELPASAQAKELGKVGLTRAMRVYFFDRGHAVHDISALDPGAASQAESQWGGLVGFASRTGDAIAKVVNRFDTQSKPMRRKKAVAEASE